MHQAQKDTAYNVQVLNAARAKSMSTFRRAVINFQKNDIKETTSNNHEHGLKMVILEATRTILKNGYRKHSLNVQRLQTFKTRTLCEACGGKEVKFNSTKEGEKYI